MAIDTQMVKKIAFLSHLKVEDDKIAGTAQEFDKILDWVGQLSEVDTTDVRPLSAVNDIDLICRKDEVTEGNQADKILKNAPVAEYDYFVVPKVVE